MPEITPGRSGTCASICTISSGRRSYATSSARRRCVPACAIQRARKPASPSLERCEHLVREPPVLADRRGQRLAVVEEDVDPDARVRARDAGHVAEAATARGERVVAVDAPRAGLVDEQVRDHVGQVARQREQAVVRAGIDRDRLGAERRDERVEVAVARRVRVGDRGQEPGRADEQVDHRVLGAAHLAAADRDARRRSAHGHPAATDATTALLVEPMSVTVGPGSRARAPRRSPPAARRSERRRRRARRRRPPRADRRAPSSRSRARRAAARAAGSGS